jgi:hypothetical protein
MAALQAGADVLFFVPCGDDHRYKREFPEKNRRALPAE